MAYTILYTAYREHYLRDNVSQYINELHEISNKGCKVKTCVLYIIIDTYPLTLYNTINFRRYLLKKWVTVHGLQLTGDENRK